MLKLSSFNAVSIFVVVVMSFARFNVTQFSSAQLSSAQHRLSHFGVNLFKTEFSTLHGSHVARIQLFFRRFFCFAWNFYFSSVGVRSCFLSHWPKMKKRKKIADRNPCKAKLICWFAFECYFFSLFSLYCFFLLTFFHPHRERKQK